MRDKLFRVVIRSNAVEQPDILASFTNDKPDRKFAVQCFVRMLMELTKAHLNKWYCSYSATVATYSFIQDCSINILPIYQILFSYIFYRGPGSSVGIATGFGLDGPGIESRWRRVFPHLSRPNLGPIQPPVQWVPSFSRGVKSGRGVTLTPHSLLVPWSRKSRAIPLLPIWAVRPVQSLSACTRVTFPLHFITYLNLDLIFYILIYIVTM
jgi:hypothetical protein